MNNPIDYQVEFVNAIRLLRSHLLIEEEMDLETYNIRRGMIRSETGEFLRRVWNGVARRGGVEPANVDGEVGQQAEAGQRES